MVLFQVLGMNVVSQNVFWSVDVYSPLLCCVGGVMKRWCVKNSANANRKERGGGIGPSSNPIYINVVGT